MLIRVLQLTAVTLYIVCAIALVAYLERSIIWAILLIAPAFYVLVKLPETPGYAARQYKRAVAERHRQIEKRVAELERDPLNAPFIPLVRRGRLFTDAELAGLRRRIAELEAVPHRRKYGQKVVEGIDWTDEQIDYYEDASRLALCEHLRLMEASLRQQGFQLSLVQAGVVRAPVLFHEAKLRETFGLPVFLVIHETEGDRFGPKEVHLACDKCGSRLEEAGYGPAWPAG